MIYDTGVSQMNSLQSAMNKTQMQLSANKKILSAADDPIASARALQVTQSQSVNTQLTTNRTNANTSLGLEETALSNVTDLLNNVQALIVKAGNAAYSDADRASMAIELQGTYDDLIAAANSDNGAGGYLFSGYKTDTVPYTATATGALYAGDQGVVSLQVGTTRSVPTADPGSRVFEGNLTGNGTFATGGGTPQADGSVTPNTGAGVISPGTVQDGAQLTGHKYQLNFTTTAADATTGAAAVTTYTVMDTTLNQPVPATPNPATPIAFKSGEAIVVDGQSMTITGTPANGDTFTIEPSTKESVFTTIKDLLTVLGQKGTGEAGSANLANSLSRASQLMATAADNVLAVRADVGARMNELDYLDGSGEALKVQYATTLSGLVDLDYVSAISLFTQQQTTLTAAQKSFTAISGLSLFNYIS
jgi:flagellar hook-associated protein 3 FlgL